MSLGPLRHSTHGGRIGGLVQTFPSVLRPYLIANELIGRKDSQPQRYVIDFQGLTLLQAQAHKSLFEKVKREVLPDRQAAAKEEAQRNKEALTEDAGAKVNHHHANFLKQWWQLSYAREDLVDAITNLRRYIVCGQVTLRPIFEFVHPEIRPNAALVVFPYEDDYSFGILQSDVHWLWFVNRCSTLTGRPRYTSNTVFDSFPWPQQPSAAAVSAVADAAVVLRRLRNQLKKEHDLSPRELYRALELPGASPLKVAHKALDHAVRSAYGMRKGEDPLAFLLHLNQQLAASEADGLQIQGPGLPAGTRKAFVTADCLRLNPPLSHQKRA